MPGLIADLIDLGGVGLSVTTLPHPLRGEEDHEVGEGAGPGTARVGVHRSGIVPSTDLEAFDILLSVDPFAPRPWVSVGPDRLDLEIEHLQAAVTHQSAACAVAVQVLRMTLNLPFDQALALESFAYSMLLASAGFRNWRAATPIRERAEDSAPRVLIRDTSEGLDLQLNRPSVRNAFDAAMRDALDEALAFALAHPDAPLVTLSGVGPCFSAGGDLDTFGLANDVALAHLIRTVRAPARQVNILSARITALLHGACVGAGIEIPAAAGQVIARPGTTFRLPEVSMGLIPGAGGTVTIPRRIGRHRAAYMAISGAEITLETALAWGLVDAVTP